MHTRKKRRCKVDVFFDGVAIVKTSFFDADFTAWFGFVTVYCTHEEAERLLERETVIRFDNGEGGTAKLVAKFDADIAHQPNGEFHEFYFVGTSPLLALQPAAEAGA